MYHKVKAKRRNCEGVQIIRDKPNRDTVLQVCRCSLNLHKSRGRYVRHAEGVYCAKINKAAKDNIIEESATCDVRNYDSSRK